MLIVCFRAIIHPASKNLLQRAKATPATAPIHTTTPPNLAFNASPAFVVATAALELTDDAALLAALVTMVIELSAMPLTLPDEIAEEIRVDAAAAAPLDAEAEVAVNDFVAMEPETMITAGEDAEVEVDVDALVSGASVLPESRTIAGAVGLIVVDVCEVPERTTTSGAVVVLAVVDICDVPDSTMTVGDAVEVVCVIALAVVVTTAVTVLAAARGAVGAPEVYIEVLEVTVFVESIANSGV